MGGFSGELRVSYFPLIDRVNGLIIYMQKFRQLIPNIAESWKKLRQESYESLGRTIYNSL